MTGPDLTHADTAKAAGLLVLGAAVALVALRRGFGGVLTKIGD